MSATRFSYVEFCLVIASAFGWAIIGSVYALAADKTVGQVGVPDAFTDKYLLGVVLQELLLAPVAASILYVRGWRIADFHVHPSILATVLGLGIALIAFVADWLITFVVQLAFPAIHSALQIVDAFKPTHGPGLPTIVLVSLINPVFEEVFVCGYVIEALRERFGLTTAINVSVLIRASYHLYQGIGTLPFHCAYGLLQAYAYVRFRRLWPLIVSHAVLDFAAFVQMI